MSDETSALLGLPYIQAAQAQKHVTHNEALRMLDVLVQSSVTARGLDTPPAGPAEGDRYIVGAAPTGDWENHPLALALYETGVWQFYTPQAGWLVYVRDEGLILGFDGSAWINAITASGLLGLNTSADTTNRLAVAAEATLLTHDGAGHQLKINKKNQGETASLLFQSDWVGCAEMGLAGSNDFSIKVYDGSAWIDALTFDRNSGHASGTAVQSSATDTTSGRLARADYAYGPGNLLGSVSQSSGTPTGAVIESGSNAGGDYIRFADGTQICWSTRTINYFAAGWCENTWVYPAAFVAAPVVSFGVEKPDNMTPGIGELGPAIVETVGASNVHLRQYRMSGGTNFVGGDQVPVHAIAHGHWF